MGLAKVRFHLMGLYGSVFLTQMCLGIAFIATPILALEMEASPILIGLIGASGGATYAVMARIFGSASDRFSRKKLLLTAEVVQAFSMVLSFLSQDPYQLIFARFVFSVGLALYWPLSEAYIGDLAGADQLGQALTGYNVSWSSATIVGPQLGGLLIMWYFIRTPFLVALVGFLFAAVLLLSGTVANINRSHHTSHLSNDEKLVREDRKVFPLIYAFLFAFTGAILSAIFPAYATQLGVSADLIGLMFLLSGLTQTLTVILANRLQSKLGEGRMLLLSSFFLFFALTMIGLALAMPIFFVSFAIFGLGQGMAYSTALLLVLKGSASRRGKAAGLFESTLGVGFFTGPLVGGAFYQIGGPYPYFLGALVSLSIMAHQLFMMLRRIRVRL
jgi:DHA1 family multidrug resistance protein-like MFS transporter